jgi:hypothetical protein
MAEPFDVRVRRGCAQGDAWGRSLDESLRQQGAAQVPGPYGRAHKLDGEEAMRELRQLLEWYFYEKERQSLNRLDMAMDCDFYDNLQWDPDDAAVLRDRGQMPLVYNEVARWSTG